MRALDIRRRLIRLRPNDHKELMRLAMSLNECGKCYLGDGQTETAERYFRETVKNCDTVLAKNESDLDAHFYNGIYLTVLARTVDHRGERS